MSFPNTESYVYSLPSSEQSLFISTTIIPAIEIVSMPAAVTNSLQAGFDIRVYNSASGATLTTANLFYKLDDVSTYTSLGTSRQLTLPVIEGVHEIFFVAEINGTYSLAPAQYSWTVDTTRPFIVNIQPEDGTTQVNTSPTILVEFSENMNTTATIAALSLTPFVSGDWSGTGSIFTFIPTTGLAHNQSYTIEIAATATDLAGNTILAPNSAQFVTIQSPNQPPDPPNFVNLFNPTHTSSKNIIFKFNVPLDANSDALHFSAEVATNSTFTNNLQTFSTISNPEMFIYYNEQGNKVGSFPSIGVPPGVGKVIFNPRTEYANGQYWVRFFANDRR